MIECLWIGHSSYMRRTTTMIGLGRRSRVRGGWGSGSDAGESPAGTESGGDGGGSSGGGSGSGGSGSSSGSSSGGTSDDASSREDAGASLSGTYKGYIQSFMFPDGTDTVVMTLAFAADGTVTGTVFFGTGPVLAPPTNPERGLSAGSHGRLGREHQLAGVPEGIRIYRFSPGPTRRRACSSRSNLHSSGRNGVSSRRATRSTTVLSVAATAVAATATVAAAPSAGTGAFPTSRSRKAAAAARSLHANSQCRPQSTAASSLSLPRLRPLQL